MATLNANMRGVTANPAGAPAKFDLQTELQKVLSDVNFSFSGNFYHSSLLSNPPNPCLTIEGLGMIGLPLGERDTQAIIAACPTRKVAPSRRGRGRGKGKAKGTRAKKEVQTTWELEETKFSFGNTAWQNYVDQTLCSTICKSLGVRIGTSSTKMVLSKLVVYETGAHLLPDEEMQKIDGVFGTAMVLLPSAYTGGQVIVSHGSTMQTIDFAKESMLSTALLAWYNDVQYEVKPVESGYRVALAYNLVHAPGGNGSSLPCLPDMTNSTNELRSFLEKWKSNKANENSPPYLAYLLKGGRDSFIFLGALGLTGVDLHQATVIRPVAEAAGFRMYVASLEHKISGFSENIYHKRRRSRYHSYSDGWDDEDEDEDDTPRISEINSITTQFTRIGDMDGVTILYASEMDVGSNCLVPNKPFEDEDPDETKDDMCGQLVYCHRRTVLVLMPEDTADDILYEAIGTSYAYRMLSKSTNIPPTSDDRKWAERLILKGGHSLKESDILLLLKSALSWKDAELWKSTTSIPSCTMAMINSNTLMNPMEVFTFEELRDSFEALLVRSKALADNMDFLSKFAPKGASNQNNDLNLWYQQEVMKIVSSYTSAKVEDVPTLLSFIRLLGLQSFRNLVMPNLEKHHQSYGFWIAFVKALSANSTAILEQESSLVPPTLTNTPTEIAPSAPPQTAQQMIHDIISQSLKHASTEWNQPGFGPNYYFNPYSNTIPILVRNIKLDRIIEVLEQAIAISDSKIPKIIFDDILTNKWFTTFRRIHDIFLPLLPPLRELLKKKNLNEFQSPFVDFIRSFVGLYLREILGKRTELSAAHMRKVGCPSAESGHCAHCKALDDFIMNPKIRTTLIRAPKAQRLHLEQYADEGLDLYSYEIVKSTNPNGLQLTKLPAAIEASTWASRQKSAKIFLDTVGSWNDISRIMGDRISDVKSAFEGSRPYDTPSASTTATIATTPGSATAQKNSQIQAPRVANAPQAGPSASNTATTAVPRKASATGFPQQVVSKKRKT